MTIVRYNTPESILNGCEIGLKYQLHNVDGSLVDWYRYTIRPKYSYLISRYIVDMYICFDNDEPVGVFAIMNRPPVSENSNCSIFVKDKFRRQGIATKLIKTATDNGAKFVPWTDSYLAKTFYQKVLSPQTNFQEAHNGISI